MKGGHEVPQSPRQEPVSIHYQDFRLHALRQGWKMPKSEDSPRKFSLDEEAYLLENGWEPPSPEDPVNIPFTPEAYKHLKDTAEKMTEQRRKRNPNAEAFTPNQAVREMFAHELQLVKIREQSGGGQESDIVSVTTADGRSFNARHLNLDSRNLDPKKS